MGLGPLRGQQKRRRNRPRRHWVLCHKRRKLQHFFSSALSTSQSTSENQATRTLLFNKLVRLRAQCSPVLCQISSGFLCFSSFSSLIGLTSFFLLRKNMLILLLFLKSINISKLVLLMVRILHPSLFTSPNHYVSNSYQLSYLSGTRKCVVLFMLSYSHLLTMRQGVRFSDMIIKHILWLVDFV